MSADLTTYRDRYRDDLLLDTLPFWLDHGIDPDHGGVFTSLGRDGSVICTDKAIWPQGRFAWLLATLHQTVEPRQEWLDAALSCLTFLERHATDSDGRMFFLVTKDGRPLRKRRYVYSEAFAAMAYAACARATKRDDLATRARELFALYTKVSFEPGHAPPKVDQQTRPSKGIGPLMIGINLARTLKDTIAFEDADAWITRCIDEIERDFYKPHLQVLMETVGPDGAIIDHLEERTLNPGHAIEAAWFLLHEARLRDRDPHLIELGTSILDAMWERGWDSDHGGLFYFRDLHGHPVQSYWHDMKFWWPHNEAIIATLLAHTLTGAPRHLERHRKVHDWAHRHFADRDHGEWFGYLHRDGSPSSDAKGTHWKGPFHLPRMQWYCWQLLEEHLASAS